MNLLTFDVEDWFHILDHDACRTVDQWGRYPSRIYESVYRILDLLDQNDIKATFFCLGWIADRYPDVIRRIDSMGHELGSHSYSHQLVSSQTTDEFREDLGLSLEILQNITGKKVNVFRAPGFSFNKDTPWMIETLLNYGITIDCSISPAAHSHGGERSFSGRLPQLICYQGMKIKEFPLNYLKISGLKLLYSGGGYFRLFPYWLTSHLVRRSDYVMTYFHPRDFDPEQPVLEDLSLIRKFKSYYGLSFAFKKLSALVEDHSFMRICDADAQIDWSSASIFDFG